MRYSTNEEIGNIVKNGFDYKLHCWIKDFIIQRCGHPETMSCGCFGKEFEGQDIRDLVDFVRETSK